MSAYSLNFWSERDDALLRRFWEGGMSAREIAAVMRGRSRNAVIGRAARLGLRRRPITDRKPRERTRLTPEVAALQRRLRLERAAEDEARWQSLLTRREPCVGCGVREDQHDEHGCRQFLHRRAA